jgi:ferritin
MLSKKIESELNKQVKYEAKASFFYLSIASWCEQKRLNGAASFYYLHAEEERTHMLKIFKYINEMGGHALVPELKEPEKDFKNILDIVEKSLESEKSVTASIHKLSEQAREDKDYGTYNFIQFFVDEQREEEILFNNVLDKIHLIGMDGQGLYYIDKEFENFAKLKTKPAKKPDAAG